MQQINRQVPDIPDLADSDWEFFLCSFEGETGNAVLPQVHSAAVES